MANAQVLPKTHLKVLGSIPADAARLHVVLSTRARRFPIQTPLHYRQRGATGWNETTTVNISRSIVVFNSAKELPVGTPLEMQILFPARITGGAPSMVICSGPVIRTERHRAAAAILHYSFRQITA
jgi:hypothetical protein